MKGNGMPMQNQGQNFLPKLFAICPAIKGMTSGKKSKGNAKTTSIFFVFKFFKNSREPKLSCRPSTIKPNHAKTIFYAASFIIAGLNVAHTK